MTRGPDRPGGKKKMMPQTRDEAYEPAHTASQTALALEVLPALRLLPSSKTSPIRARCPTQTTFAAFADIFDALVASLADTRMEPDLEEVLWGQVNLFHRATARIERSLDDNEQARRRLQREQDGSEVKSTELGAPDGRGPDLTERRNCMDMMRDHAASEFWHHTGLNLAAPHRPTKVNHQHLTAALIDSRDFLAAKRRAETEVMLPAGPKVAFTGGTDFNDHRLIWVSLDQVRTKYPDMVLLHGGSPKGAELIAAKWPAEARGVTQVAFKPDRTKHAKAAPFKRNDAMLDVLPVGVLVFPGNGIQETLADKAEEARHPGGEVRAWGVSLRPNFLVAFAP